jgi:hypothetical protein
MDSARAARITNELKHNEIDGWVIIDQINHGKSAVVLRAEKGDETAAIKVFDPDLVERFGREIQLERINRERGLIGQSHPHLIKIIGGGACEDSDFLYVIHEYLQSKDLNQVLNSVPRQSYRKIEIKFLASIWKMLCTLKNGKIIGIKDKSEAYLSNEIYEACSQLSEDGKISEFIWDELTEGADELKDAFFQMKGPREERVRYFKKVTTDATLSKIKVETFRDFVFGYLANLLSPGTMDHLDIVATNVHRYQNSLIWYGLFAGLHRESKIMSEFNVLGRRVLRDIVKEYSILDSPTCDISLDELEVLLSSNAKPIPFRAFSSNRLEVELMPCISTFLKWPTKDYAEQLGLFSQYYDSPYQKDLLHKLGTLLAQAADVQKQISESLSDPKVSSSAKRTKKGKRDRPKKP